MRVLLTGGTGFLGRHVAEALSEADHQVLSTAGREGGDLREPEVAAAAIDVIVPDVVVHLAYPGTDGIATMQTAPGTLAADTALIDLQVIRACAAAQVPRLICMGSVCAYPETAPSFATEEDLWKGAPEAVNAPYGHARRFQAALLQAFRRETGLESVQLILGNLYGPGDRSGHVIPALVRRCLQAKRAGDPFVTVWGSGRQSREFLYVEDAADAIRRAVEADDLPDDNLMNIVGGPKNQVAIRGLAEQIAALTGFTGRLCFDATKPDGQPQRSFAFPRAQHWLGWTPTTPFDQGLAATVAWIRSQEGH